MRVLLTRLPTHAPPTSPQAPLVGLPCGGEIGPAARRGPATGLATQKGSARLQVLYALYVLYSTYASTYAEQYVSCA